MSLRRLVIVDYGSQYSFLLGRRLRSELGVWCEIIPPFQMNTITASNTIGVILSGGPESVEGNAYHREERRVIEDPAIPVLGICYGMHLIGTVRDLPVKALNKGGEFGPTTVIEQQLEPLFIGCFIDGVCRVWMSHNDTVVVENENTGIVVTSRSPLGVASFRIDSIKCWAVQWHPEVTHTQQGTRFLQNWVEEIAGVKSGSWNSKSRLEQCIQAIQKIVGENDRVVLGLSGGVDSMTTAAILSRVLQPEQWRAVLVDHGMMREGEVLEVERTCREQKIPLIVRDDSEEFFAHLKGIEEPEHKRKLIGALFVSAFETTARDFHPTVLAQGTIYPDVVESGKADNTGSGSATKSHTIKSHHNVGGLPPDIGLKLLEPLRWLFKDEVRKLGRELGLPEAIIGRHPFPGPGIAIRIVGKITKRKVHTVQTADRIFVDAIREAGLYDKISQAYAALLDSQAVGVVGDQRREGNIVVLRAICTQDFMTAHVYPFDVTFLEAVSVKIVNACTHVTRVMYDTTPKPPGTVELE